MTSTTETALVIEKIVGGGRGLARNGESVWMIDGALPDERVRVEVLRRRRAVVEARTVELLSEPHAARDLEPCVHASRCGGCDWPHVEPGAGALLKRDVAAEAARGLPELAQRLRQAPVTPSPPAYRLRARLHWDPNRAVLGFYRRRSHDVETIPDCRILSRRLIETLGKLSATLAATCPDPVDVEWLEDLQGTRAVAGLRRASDGPEPSSSWIPSKDALGAAGPDGFHLLGSSGRLERVWGRDHVRMALPIVLEVPVGAFFQGNRHLVPWLFDRIAGLIGPEPVPTWDLHAGVGFLAAAAMHAAPRPLILAETFRPSARAARRNLPEATVRVGRSAEDVLRRSGRLPRKALAILDPPRCGLSANLGRRLAGWHPDRILMLACDPATWARDTGRLLDNGYRLSHLELIDLFPSSHHVEVLSVLETV